MIFCDKNFNAMIASLHKKKTHSVTALLLIALMLNIALWLYGRSFQSIWVNVPPVPSNSQKAGAGLSDSQFAYRSFALSLQNAGDYGGRSNALDAYDYDRLAKWFSMMDTLDERSDFVAFLAAYYFGAISNEEKLRPLVAYLANTGERAYKEKWRFLAHAAYLARFEMNDLDLALEYAQRLSALEKRSHLDLPLWASQMHIYIQNLQGNKEEAYGLMLNILETEASKMHPNEVNFMRDYICTRILGSDQAKTNELCRDIP